LADIHFHRKEYKEAEERIHSYLAKKPNDREAKMLLGRMFAEMGNRAHAIQIFEELSKADPNDTEALTAVAELHKEAGSVEKALRTADTLVNLQGKRATAEDLSDLNKSLKLYEGAVHAYSSSVREVWDRNLKLVSEEGEKEITTEDDLSLLMGSNILSGIDEEPEALFTEEADFIPGEDEVDLFLGSESYGEMPESSDFSEEMEKPKYDDPLDALADPALAEEPALEDLARDNTDKAADNKPYEKPYEEMPELAEEIPIESAKEIPKETPEEFLKETLKEIPGEIPKETPIEVSPPPVNNTHPPNYRSYPPPIVLLGISAMPQPQTPPPMGQQPPERMQPRKPEPVPFEEEEETLEELELEQEKEEIEEIPSEEPIKEPVLEKLPEEKISEPIEDNKQEDLSKVLDLLGFLHGLTEALPEERRKTYTEGKLQTAMGSVIDSLKNLTIIKE